MSLLTILKTIGHDLKDVGGWIDDGLKAVDPIITVIDPPLGAILTEIETVLNALTNATCITTVYPAQPSITTVYPAQPTSSPITLTPSELQSIITAITTVTAVKSATSKSVHAVFKH